MSNATSIQHRHCPFLQRVLLRRTSSSGIAADPIHLEPSIHSRLFHLPASHQSIMITNFFVLSPRGDTVIAKNYRSKSGVGAHERSHTEAFFRKVKFWDGVAPGTPGMDTTLGLGTGAKGLSSTQQPGAGGEGVESKESAKRFGDAPPVFVMPDGYSYMHVKRNGLIFGCATEKNVSPVVVIEVSIIYVQCSWNCERPGIFCRQHTRRALFC